MNASLERVLTVNPHTADATADPFDCRERHRDPL